MTALPVFCTWLALGNALEHAQSRTGAGDALGLAGETGTSVGFCHLPPGGRPSISQLPLWSLCLGGGECCG